MLTPLQYAVDRPIAWLQELNNLAINRNNLITENNQLLAQQMLLQAQLQKFTALEKENQQLRELLQSGPKIADEISIAQILAVSTNLFSQTVIIDKGEKHNVYVCQAVIDAYGILGQVIATNLYSSQVLLITDKKSAIPVKIVHNNLRAIASGDNTQLKLLNIAKTEKINIGDILVSSGLGFRFPENYPVGIVTSVSYNPGETFAKIDVAPSAKISSSSLVLLVWPIKKCNF